MTRRHFLKTLALTAIAAATVAAPSSLSAGAKSAAPAAQSALNGTLFAGTNQGRIMVSEDGGKSWLPRADFGDHCSVLSVVLRQEQLLATIAVQGFTFTLASGDGHVWRTVA